jgi:hypothetical protein
MCLQPALLSQSVAPPSERAEASAVAYLAAEVPRWRRQHACYSCHNNGDAVRALIAARSRGHAVTPAIEDSLAWLAQPDRWDANELRGSEDLPLARIQFAGALAMMRTLGPSAAARPSPEALTAAANKVLRHQHADGSWRLGETQLLGGATFYGTSLATAMARASIALGDRVRMREALARADTWLRAASVAIVLDASSVLIGLAEARDPEADAQRERALSVLKRGQAPDGGWGPYASSPAEPFDTALALLALAPLRTSGAPLAPYTARELDDAMARGRRYLTNLQADDGSWPETTRPPGGESYAQRISTTAWALLALFASD